MHSDAELVLQARSGDRQAFAAIYDRYADRIHDFCHSVLRDRDEAADAMQDTFVLAAQRMGQLQDPSKLRSWLFAVARHEAIRRSKARRRAAPTEGVGNDAVADDSSPEDAVSRGEAQAIVWAAAAGLSDRDRVLLDLHLRQDLDGHELADAIGVSAQHAYTLMNRLRDQVERSLGALLVARLGRDDCTDLQALLEPWDGRFTPLWRKRVARHVDECEVCSERRRILTSPLSLLAAAPLVPAPIALRSLTLDRMESVALDGVMDEGLEISGDGDPAHGWSDPSARGGFPPGIGKRPWIVPRRWARAAMTVGAAALMAVMVFGVSYVTFDDDEGARSTVVAAARPTTPTSQPPETALVPGSTPSTTTTPPSTTDGSAITTPGGDTDLPNRGSTTTTSTTTPVDRTPPDVSVSVGSADVWEDDDKCQTRSTTASASVQDASAIQSVSFSYDVGSVSVSAPMTPGGGGNYTGAVGPFPVSTVSGLTTFSVEVTAVDEAGNDGSASITLHLHPASECVVIQ